jgi:hypothetical protein
VVVPRQREREAVVGVAQVLVESIGRMAEPVVRDRLQLVGGEGRPIALGRAGVLVDVVAEVHDQVDVFVEQVPVGGVGAHLEPLAVDHRQTEPLRGALGECSRPGHGARVVAHREPVVVVGGGLEAVDVDVHGVGVARLGRRHAGAHDGLEAIIARHLPRHLDRPVRHAAEAVGGERIRGQPGPQDDRFGQRVPRGDSEREGVVGEVERRPAGVDVVREGRGAVGRIVAGAAGHHREDGGP